MGVSGCLYVCSQVYVCACVSVMDVLKCHYRLEKWGSNCSWALLSHRSAASKKAQAGSHTSPLHINP